MPQAPRRLWVRWPMGALSTQYFPTDIMLPGGLSGLELGREIRQRRPNLRIVLTTGNAEAAAGMDVGEFGLLLKPYSAEALANVLTMEAKGHP